MSENVLSHRVATRRAALTALSAGAAVTGLGACGALSSDDLPDSAASPDGTSGTAPSPGATPTCVLTPEGTEGPFYVDVDLVRRDIAEGRPGVPVTLRLTVVDAVSCEPLSDAEVDVWHADATGVYSGITSEGTDGESFLRGIQVTDEEGTVEFATLYPGWYDRRTVHFHVKVHVEGDVVHTGQLYFDDEINEHVSQVAPYEGRGGRETTNDNDMFYPSSGRESTLQATGSVDEGYEAVMVLGVQPD